MEIECTFLDSDDEFSNSPTLPQNCEVSSEEPQNSNEIFLTPEGDSTSPIFQDAIGTQSVNQEPRTFDIETDQERTSGIDCYNSFTADTNPTSESSTPQIEEESSHYSTVPISTQNRHVYIDNTANASSSLLDSLHEDSTADLASNSIDNDSLLNFTTNSPIDSDNTPNSIHSTNIPTNENSIENNGDIPIVDFSCQVETLVNDYSSNSPDCPSQVEGLEEIEQLNDNSTETLLNTNSQNQTLENQMEHFPNSPNFPNSMPQTQTLDISYEDITEYPNTPELIAQSQTLESAIDSNGHSIHHSQGNSQTLENSISCYQGDQQLMEECDSTSNSQSLYNPTSHTHLHRASSKRKLNKDNTNTNHNTKFPSFTEDSYLPRGCYKSKFKYIVPKPTNRNIEVGAMPAIQRDKRPQDDSVFPCEETDIQITENPSSPTERQPLSSEYYYPNCDIDQSLLSTLDHTLQCLAAEQVEEDPICISSEETDNEPDLYTQIELMDTKNFDLNIAIADLDNPQACDIDMSVSILKYPTLSPDSEPEPKVRKPRKVPEKISKRNKVRDPAFVPNESVLTDVSSDESLRYTPKPKKGQKEKYIDDVQTEKTDEIEIVQKVGRPRKYEKVKDTVPLKAHKPPRIRKYRHRGKKRHGPAYYARKKEQAILEGRYLPKPGKKKNCTLFKKHKHLNSESDEDYSYNADSQSLRRTQASDVDYFSTPKMELWSTGNTQYDNTMQMLSNKQKNSNMGEYFNTPYLKKVKLPKRFPEHSIEMKIVGDGASSRGSYTPAQGLRLMNADVLGEVFGKLFCPLSSCKGRKLKLYESTLKNGMQTSFVVFCSYCGHIVTRFCSSRHVDQPVSHNVGLSFIARDRSEVNIRAMLGVHTTSLTWRGFRKFANIMDLPTPTTVMRRSEQARFAEIVLAEVDESMRKWSKFIADSEDAVQSVRPGCVDIAVSFDGSWKQRGHYSNVGFAAVIERKSKKVVDYELLNRNCEACSKWSTHLMETKPKEYEAWYEAHKPDCKSNFTGTSLAMESEAAVRMWRRSEDRGLVYNVFIGDGDGSGYKSVIKSCVYNGEVDIQKEECVGHLQKRLKNHLMKATKKTKACDYVQHSLEEHKADRVAHLFAVVVGQHVGKPPEEMSNALWRMLGHISENHDECPPGPNSYCLYQKHLYRHENDPTAPAPKKRRCYFTDIDLEKIREEFKTYASVDVCNHLTLGATQNVNESLHSCIWSSCLKTKYTSPTCVAISVALSVLCFNEGQSALVGVLLALGIQPSLNSIKEFVSNDILRVYNREFSKTNERKAHRRQRKIDSKNREMQRRKHDKLASRILYQSDKYGVEAKSKSSAKKPKKSNKLKVPTPDTEDRTGNISETVEQGDIEPGTAEDLIQDGTESNIIEDLETEFHDTAEFESHSTSANVNPTAPTDGEKTTESKQKKINESKTKKINESKTKKINEIKTKKINESKTKKTTESKQEKSNESKQKKSQESKLKKTKKTTESKTKSKSDTKDQNASIAGVKRKKAKRTKNESADDTEDYTTESIKKPKLRKRQKKPSISEDSTNSSSPAGSDGEESDGVCEDCTMRFPVGIRKRQWKWIGCEKCGKWFHDSCMNVQLEDFGDEDFICKACS